MVSKIKDFWVWFTGGLAALAGILWFFLSRKDKEVSALKAKLDLADTEKKADMIEVEIKEIRNQKKRTATEIKKIDEVLEELNTRREDMANQVKSATEEEIVDYWNK